jgi:hypothetical protein
MDRAYLSPASKYRSPKWEKIAREYQELLSLRDWTLYVFEVPACQLEERCLGCCCVDEKIKVAQIRLLRAEDAEALYTKEDGMAAVGFTTQEATLVHEILHVWTEQFCPADSLNNDSHEHITMEQAVDAISRCIYNLKTQKHSRR